MFTLPDLPYGYDALEPAMSSDTLHFHHDKHHKKYVDTVNQLVEKSGKHPASLEAVIEAAVKDGDKKLFNNAAQAWNHAFFWNCMTPKASKPQGDLLAAIERDFGGLDKLRDKFVADGEAQFGSGWAWLIEQDGKLSVVTTHDAHAPMATPGVKPLLVCDVWEHAYYLDHQNNRKAFLEAFFDRLANWSFAEQQLAAKQAWAYPVPVRETA
ncbi:MAG TPA: superoxide dismutase [Caulobacteraceae bacterium]|jgi:Fe-Mn family superoxide dismutase